jgi:hypothetical protein
MKISTKNLRFMYFSIELVSPYVRELVFFHQKTKCGLTALRATYDPCAQESAWKTLR